MKFKLLSIMFLSALASCGQKVTLELDFGAITPLMERGSFGSQQTRSTYCVYLVGSEHKLKQGYLIINLTRTRKDENEAYRILDKWEEARKARDIDMDNYNWALYADQQESYKAEVLEMRRNYFDYSMKVNKHVRLVVDKKALETGIDYDSKLIYAK